MEKAAVFDFKNYLAAHTVRPLTHGKSGAEVCLLDDHKIAKFSEKSKLLEKENGAAVWEACLKEAEFYKDIMGLHHAFLPEIFHCHFDDDNVQIIMGEYFPLAKENLTCGDFDKIMELLTQVHELPLLDFLKNEKQEPLEISDEEIQSCLDGWKSVFEEHDSETSDTLNFSKLQELASHINQLNKDMYSARVCLCHGDFHAENILQNKKNGRLILCDWQSVCLKHPASDIAFFMSRLSGDGIVFDENKIIESYCRYSKSGITKDEIKNQIKLSNINTTFRYWHYYLHGSSRDAVENIIKKNQIFLEKNYMIKMEIN